ncbi:MAG: DUF4383 domain-containing protein [Corynebacteriales bacterium]|nr:DUF4383 domain-containing protein [Mycobacteriales bacterium]
MAHFPVDHPMRGFYRGLALLSGIALTVYGVAGFVKTSGMDFFDRAGEQVWGLNQNPAFAVLNIAAGVLLVVGNLIGRNLDVLINVAIGSVMSIAGMAMLALLRTDSNFLAFTVTNVNVSFVIGTILFTAGMYGAVSRPKKKKAVKKEAATPAVA